MPAAIVMQQACMGGQAYIPCQALSVMSVPTASDV